MWVELLLQTSSVVLTPLIPWYLIFRQIVPTITADSMCPVPEVIMLWSPTLMYVSPSYRTSKFHGSYLGPKVVPAFSHRSRIREDIFMSSLHHLNVFLPRKARNQKLATVPKSIAIPVISISPFHILSNRWVISRSTTPSKNLSSPVCILLFVSILIMIAIPTNYVSRNKKLRKVMLTSLPIDQPLWLSGI